LSIKKTNENNEFIFLILPMPSSAPSPQTGILAPQALGNKGQNQRIQANALCLGTLGELGMNDLGKRVTKRPEAVGSGSG